MPNNQDIYGLAGIGIGPFNLSLAALADRIPDLRAVFFDRKPEFTWHPGLAFDESVMQTSYLKDLATPIEPTNPWTFLNFLVQKGRFHDFLAGRFDAVSRREFTEYLAWAAKGIETCHFGTGIETVDHDGASFVLRDATGRSYRSHAISVGTGQIPRVPEGAPLGEACFHGIEYLSRQPDTRGKRVVVVGGGQTGAEIVLDMLRQDAAPAQLTWISRRDAFWTLQDGSLIDQIFTPAYRAHYRSLPAGTQRQVLDNQKYSSDGLTQATADAIYRALYHRIHLDGDRTISLRPGRTVTKVQQAFRSFQILTETQDGGTEACVADIVILATGFRPAVPECLSPLMDRLVTEPTGALALDDTYRVTWDGPAAAAIYGLNHGRWSQGIADPQLSLNAWRAATILEDVLGRRQFPALHGQPEPMVAWERIAPHREDTKRRAAAY